MSRDKYADKKPPLDERYRAVVNVPVEATPLDEPDETACLRIARYRDGRIAVQLEIDDKVVRGGPGVRAKRDGLADLARATSDLQKLVAAPVGRGRR